MFLSEFLGKYYDDELARQVATMQLSPMSFEYFCSDKPITPTKTGIVKRSVEKEEVPNSIEVLWAASRKNNSGALVDLTESPRPVNSLKAILAPAKSPDLTLFTYAKYSASEKRKLSPPSSARQLKPIEQKKSKFLSNKTPCVLRNQPKSPGTVENFARSLGLDRFSYKPSEKTCGG